MSTKPKTVRLPIESLITRCEAPEHVERENAPHLVVTDRRRKHLGIIGPGGWLEPGERTIELRCPSCCTLTTSEQWQAFAVDPRHSDADCTAAGLMGVCAPCVERGGVKHPCGATMERFAA